MLTINRSTWKLHSPWKTIPGIVCTSYELIKSAQVEFGRTKEITLYGIYWPWGGGGGGEVTQVALCESFNLTLQLYA